MIKKTLTLFLAAALLFALGAALCCKKAGAAETPQIEWAENGVLINDSIGESAQKTPKIARVSETYHMIAWADERSGYSDIYAQMVDVDGKAAWDLNGIAVCKAPNNQTSPMIIADNAGGAIIVWEDYRGNDSDIYIQRIGADGKPLWQADGVAVCTAKTAQLAPRLVSDGSGGAIITWYDYRNGRGEDVYAQRIDKNGNALWQPDGISICSLEGTQWYPEIISDDAGGAVIVWTDFRSGRGSDIYGQHINSSGESIWQRDGLPICFAAENQSNPKITGDGGGGMIVVWDDFRNDNFDIYAQKISSGGTPIWALNGVQITKGEQNEEKPAVTSSSGSGVFVCWVSRIGDYSTLMAQRIGASGEAKWAAAGIAVSKSSNVNMGNEEMATASDGGAVIVWEEKDDGPKSVYAQKISEGGLLLWDINGSPVCETSDDCELPDISINDGGAVVAWQDLRMGNYDIYAQSLEKNGGSQWTMNGIAISAGLGSVAQQNEKICYDQAGNHVVVWEDSRQGYPDIYAQKIGSSGELMWAAEGVPVVTAPKAQKNPEIIVSDNGSFIVAWEDERSGAASNIYVQKLSADGKPLFEKDGVAVSGSNTNKSALEIVDDGQGGVIVCWQEDRGTNREDIYAQRISSDGKLLWGDRGIVVCNLQSDQISPVMCFDGSGGAIIAWVDFRNGISNSDIFAQKINFNGSVAWKQNGVPVCTAPDAQKTPDIASDNSGGAIITWSDKGGGSYDIYAQKIDRTGKPLLTVDGIPLCAASGTQRDPRICSDKTGGAVVVWVDFRNANWDIYGQRMDASGAVLWGIDGLAICTAPQTQYSPQLVGGEWGTIVAWEDYRNSKSYAIYAQKLSLNGDPVWQKDGVPVCGERNGERNPQIAPNGAGGAVITWEDYRSGGSGIYAQKIRAIKID